jgi:Flp pilus assembly protein TadD
MVAVQLTAQDNAAWLSKIAKSDADIRDEKKSALVKTWIARAELFSDIWSQPVKFVMPGMSQIQVKTLLASEKIIESSQETVGNAQYDVNVYADKKLYYNESGVLIFWQVAYPVEKPLFTALEAYEKAIALDTKGASTKKIKTALENLKNNFKTDALAAYTLQKYPDALRYFEGSLASSGNPIVGQTDSLITYYAGLTARLSNDNPKALTYFAKTISIGYDQQGDIQAAYAETQQIAGDTLGAISTLTGGLEKYPTNQQIIIALINLYLKRGEDPGKILPYIETAQQNDPKNPELYRVEGGIHEQLNNYVNAEIAYKKAIALDADNFWSVYSLAVLYFNKAAKLHNEANLENDYKKAEEMSKEADAQFEVALPVFERAYQINSKEKAVVESLRNIYFRLREQSPEKLEKYEFYKEKYTEL